MPLGPPSLKDLQEVIRAALSDWRRLWEGGQVDVPPGYRTVSDLLALAHDHLLAVSVLIDQNQATDAAVIALSRFICEASARAWWIVQGETEEDQLVRLTLESRHAAKEGNKFMSSFEEEPEGLAELQHRVKAVESFIALCEKERGWKVTGGAIQDQKRPGLGEVLKQFFGQVAEERYGKAAFYMMSMVAHGQLGTADVLGDFDVTSGRRISPPAAAFAEPVASVLGLTLVGLDASIQSVATAFGWDDGVYRATVREPLADYRKRTAYAVAGARPQGRNEPCTCGSGRKYKACHGWA